jgi:hypothetical protein
MESYLITIGLKISSGDRYVSTLGFNIPAAEQGITLLGAHYPFVIRENDYSQEKPSSQSPDLSTNTAQSGFRF